MQLVLATSVVGQFKGIPKDMFNIEYFWKHSVACGLIARTISDMNNETGAGKVFCSGPSSRYWTFGNVLKKFLTNFVLLWTSPAKVEIAGTRQRQNILVLITVALGALY